MRSRDTVLAVEFVMEQVQFSFGILCAIPFDNQKTFDYSLMAMSKISRKENAEFRSFFTNAM